MIRKMELSDVSEVYEIENQSFFQPWSKQFLIKELKINKLLKHYVFEVNGEVLGFYIASFILDEVELYTIAVRKEYRNKKIATKLLTHLIEESQKIGMKKIFLEVSTKNDQAIKLYKKFFFEEVGLRKNYYQKTNEDAYIMRKDLI